MFPVYSVFTFIIIVLSMNILCTEINYKNTQQSAWQGQWLNSTNSQQFGKNSQTTPWPSLGRQRYQDNTPTTIRVPQWVRPNNGTNWVRNTNYNNFDNTRNNNFLNNEQGGSNSPTNIAANRVNNVISTGSVIKDYQENRGPAVPIDVTDDDLRQFSEELLIKDVNNAAQHINVNFQGMTSSRSTRDEAPLPLMSISPTAYTIPTISKLLPLYNNYVVEANQNEIYTTQEKNEEMDFLNTVLSTPVMQYTRDFLIRKGKLGTSPQEFQDLLRLIWFNMYSRGGGQIGSSGFEHVFLAELKNNQVSGLHNWVYFNEEEKKQTANYLGYMKKLDLGGKGYLLKFHFNFHNVDKPVDSMFIGTSPEFEMALYSTCFILRADKICTLKLNGNRFVIRTYTYRYRGKNMIGSAFADI